LSGRMKPKRNVDRPPRSAHQSRNESHIFDARRVAKPMRSSFRISIHRPAFRIIICSLPHVTLGIGDRQSAELRSTDPLWTAAAPKKVV
jgi:hypothetical protein